MGLFNHRATASSSQSQPHSQHHSHLHAHSHSMDHQQPNEQQQLDVRSSSSSSRSIHSTHSNTTVKGRASRASTSTKPLGFPVSDIALSLQHHQGDIDMTEATYTSYMATPPSHGKRSSYAPPLPPPRTTSLSHPDLSAIATSVTNIPAGFLPQPTHDHGNQSKSGLTNQPSTNTSPSPRSKALGHGSLGLTEAVPSTVDNPFTFPPISQHRSGHGTDYGSEDEEGAMKRKHEEEAQMALAKLEKTREQGRIRQARRRDKIKNKKQVSPGRGVSSRINPA